MQRLIIINISLNWILNQNIEINTPNMFMLVPRLPCSWVQWAVLHFPWYAHTHKVLIDVFTICIPRSIVLFQYPDPCFESFFDDMLAIKNATVITLWY